MALVQTLIDRKIDRDVDRNVDRDIDRSVDRNIDRKRDHFGPPLPPGLRELYDGDLRFRESPAERPFVIANFVSTLDGVVSYEIKGQAGGSAVSPSSRISRIR